MLRASTQNTFEDKGFLVLPDFVSLRERDGLQTRTSQIVRSFADKKAGSIFSTDTYGHTRDRYFLESAHQISYFFEPRAFRQDGQLRYPFAQSINKIGHALHKEDDVFKRFSYRADILTLAKDLGLQKPNMLQSMYIFKQPYMGGEVNCHQDSTFLYTEPNTVIGFWFALEDARIDNGCLWVIPGAHQGALCSRFVKKADNRICFEDRATPKWDMNLLVPLEVKAGTLVVLHGRLPHLSYTNTSKKSRHAYSLHLVDDNAYYPPSNWISKEL